MYIVAGLGNPGPSYDKTRHNVGQMVLDILSGGARFRRHKTNNFYLSLGDILLVKPDAYMNLSGPVIASLMKFHSVSDLLVLHDDIDLPLGTLRFKQGGGTAGHRGLRSISDCLGSDYARLRVGIGRPENNQSIEDFVLSNFSPVQTDIISRTIQLAAEAVLHLRDNGFVGVKQFIAQTKLPSRT